MNYKQHIEDIGKLALIELGGLRIEVSIDDYKNTYGRDRWLVSPVKGRGQVWVENVSLLESLPTETA